MAFDNLDFSSKLSRNDLFNLKPEDCDSNNNDRSKKVKKSSQKILTKLQYEMKLQLEQKKESLATLDVAVDEKGPIQKLKGSTNDQSCTASHKKVKRKKSSKVAHYNRSSSVDHDDSHRFIST